MILDELERSQNGFPISFLSQKERKEKGLLAHRPRIESENASDHFYLNYLVL